MIRALIFDFDGLILDTETPEFQSWQEIYQEYGCVLSLSTWAECVGKHGVRLTPTIIWNHSSDGLLTAKPFAQNVDRDILNYYKPNQYCQAWRTI